MARALGWLFTLESVAMLACGIFAYFDPEAQGRGAFISLMVSAGTSFLVGIVLFLSGEKIPERIPRREGILIVGLGWVFSAVFGAIPFLLGDVRLSPTEAFFESVSGFTTTGATVIADLSEWPRGILLWRSVMQWLGGLLILVLLVVLLSGSGGAKFLFSNESAFQPEGTTTARIQDKVLRFLWIYLGLTVICLLGLRGLGLSWFDAVAHAFTTVATGGFSPHNESIAHFSDLANGLLIEIWLEFFMILGSTSFFIYVVILSPMRWKELRRIEEVRWYLLLILTGVLVVWIAGALGGGVSVWESLRGAVFTVISIASTTGYATVDYEQWPVAVYFILLLLMLVGGCAGSTAGGMKVSRLILLVRAAWQEVVKAFRPKQVLGMKVNDNSIDDEARAQTVLFVALFGLISLVSMVVVAVVEMTQGIDFNTTVSAVLATFGNIGPGYGEVGPTDNYGHFQPVTQLFLSLLMIMGRLELYAVLVLFVPTVWKKY